MPASLVCVSGRSTAHRAPADRGPLARARRRIPLLVAPQPERLPDRAAIAADLSAAALRRIAAAFGDPAALACQAAQLDAQLRADHASQAADVTALVQRGTALDQDIHDAFFAIARDDGAAARRTVHVILRAVQILRDGLATAPVAIGADAVVAIAGGLERCFTIATGHRPAPIALPPLQPGVAARNRQAADRWIGGHHIFLALTQGLILAVTQLRAAHRGDDAAAVAGALADFTTLLDASSACLSFTGDFSPRIYRDVVRVAMAPPYMPEGFSGAFSHDHRHLMRMLRESRALFADIATRMPERHSGLVASMSDLYANHGKVCAHFIGRSDRSLLMRDTGDDSAIGQLEKFRRSRVRYVGGG